MKKTWILPAVAVVAIAAAIAVTTLQPKKGNDANVLTADADTGEFTILKSDVSADKITFIRPVADSKIELLARLGDDGKVKVALGTCQSCNGAPGAYYTQNGDVLQCNNCGLTFPQNVVDTPGGGCHPIIVDDVWKTTEDGAVIDTEALRSYEELFTNVAEHDV